MTPTDAKVDKKAPTAAWAQKLATMMRGALGVEEPGSVLEEGYSQRKALNQTAEGASLLSDLVPGKAALSGIVPMALGALRRGGRPDLFMSHGADASSLIPGSRLIKELTHPSFAITKDTPKAPFGNVMLIPREGKFDPRTSSSSLHSTDAWTPNWSDSYETDLIDRTIGAATPREVAKARLDDRFMNRFEKGGLNATSPTERIIGSKRYPSFEALEKNYPTGPKPTQALFKKFDKNIEEDILSRLGPNERAEVLADPGILAELTDEEISKADYLRRLLMNDPNTVVSPEVKDKVAYARKLLHKLRNAEPDYAELKQWGNVQISPDNFAGVFIKNGPDARRVQQAFEERGITTAPWAMDHASRARQANIMQEKSRRLMTPQVK